MYPYLISADTQVSTGKVEVCGIVLTAYSEAASLNIFDEADGSKTPAKLKMRLRASANTTVVCDVPFLLRSGLYADTAGTSAVATIIIK